MTKKPKKKDDPKKKADDVDLEIGDEELKDVSGGRGIRVKTVGAREARIKGLRGREALPRIKRPIKKF